ncbi:MAG: hypothetical protein M1837_003339 [Sclerophora amabilis]|nr:MAG: hypothetical protein M1837_003339 [Sclerophora amabilis]
MPAKRRAPPPAPTTTTSKSPTAPRPSKLARENNISAAEEAEIKEAFQLFATTTADDDDDNDDEQQEEEVMAIEDVRRALIALNLPPSDKQEMREILETLDPTDTGSVGYAPFVSVCALKLHARTQADDRDAQREEIEAAFGLFLGGGGGAAAAKSGGGGAGGGTRRSDVITMAHLRRVARELKEDEKIGEEGLRDMILEANGGAGVGKGVSVEDFENVMRRAGVFR